MNKLSGIILEDAERICRQVDFQGLEGKSVLITGASGLIGHYFLASLKYFSKKTGKKFKTIAIMQSAPPEYFKDFMDYKGAEIFRGDLSDEDFCRSLPKADFIIHAAGYGQPGRFMEDQVKTIKLNTAATFNLFDRLNENGKFLFLSTSEVYSGLTTPPFKEFEIGTTNTIHPRSCYIEAKRCGEAICNAYRAKGVSAKSARLSLAYGPGTKPGDKRVINNFIFKGLSGKIDLIDQGLANRTYCYVSDAVEIMWHILIKGKEPIYNVGGFSKITIGDLAKKIGEYMKAAVIFPENSGNSIIGAPDDVSLDMSKVMTEFNKKEFISLDEGLLRTIEWQKNLYKN